jgi:hypothetical protein
MFLLVQPRALLTPTWTSVRNEPKQHVWPKVGRAG